MQMKDCIFGVQGIVLRLLANILLFAGDLLRLKHCALAGSVMPVTNWKNSTGLPDGHQV
jgi:hypothetical protein